MKQNLTIVKNEHFGIARKIVSNMTAESWETIPHTAVTFEPDATGLYQVLKEITADASPEKIISRNTAMLRIIL